MSGSDQQQLTADGFATRFQSASKTLWCVAAGVLGRRDGAEDVVQEAAITAMNRLATFDATTDFVAWMASIVRFTALNARRRRRETSMGDDFDLESSGHHADPVLSDGAIDPDQRAFDDSVLRGLDALTEAQRTCLLLRVVRELDYEEIATTMGIPQGTAMSHVHRARRRLAVLLGAPTPEAGR